MERWERLPPRSGGGSGRENPSFSSTLLDAIYRSIDDEAGGGAMRVHRTGGARDPRPPPSATKKHGSGDRRTVTAAAAADKAALRRKHEHGALNNSTSSSSECSSNGGFSSSEAESAVHPAGLRPIRTGVRPEGRSGRPPPIPPPPAQQREAKKKESSIGRRFRDLRNPKAPASPGARLASFLNSLFSAGTPRRKARAAAPAGPSPAVEESTCSTASSYSRSCLSKTPSSTERRGPPTPGGGVKRSVRFYPVSVIVDEDCRPCGHKCLHDGDPAAWQPPPPPPASAAARGRQTKSRVEELLRGFEEDADGESDSSSDLFELENLTATGGGGYSDELPVYESTQFRAHRAIAQGFIM